MSHGPAVPFDQWPRWAKRLKRKAIAGEIGVGDTVKRKLTRFGGEAYKRWYKKITGHECPCTERQGWLNAKYPYA